MRGFSGLIGRVREEQSRAEQWSGERRVASVNISFWRLIGTFFSDMEGVHKPWERPFVSEIVDLPAWLAASKSEVSHWSYGRLEEEANDVSPATALYDICERMGLDEAEGLRPRRSH